MAQNNLIQQLLNTQEEQQVARLPSFVNKQKFHRTMSKSVVVEEEFLQNFKKVSIDKRYSTKDHYKFYPTEKKMPFTVDYTSSLYEAVKQAQQASFTDIQKSYNYLRPFKSYKINRYDRNLE